MLLFNLNNSLRIFILAVLGAVIAAAINWAIYRWAYFRKRSISPWLKPDEKAKPRKSTDYVPVLGWFGVRRDADVHGKGFWIRPLLIELVWIICLPLFYNWHVDGGLSGGGVVGAANAATIEIWFFVQTILLALLTVATFIDFDEKTIPDGVTVTGLIIALLVAAFAPMSRLPVLVKGANSFLHFNSPLELTAWHQESTGLMLALSIFTIWYLALLPKTINFRLGFFKGIKIMIGSVVRPRRKPKIDIRSTPRKPLLLTKILTAIWLVGTIAVFVAWQTLPAVNKTSLFSAFMGMAAGGGLVWTVRIIASSVLNQEAMGFGDVTLMFMIGAFLGWQPSLLVFGLAPLSMLLIALAYFIATRDNQMAFGPYLCLSTLILILFWHPIWSAVELSFFGIGAKPLLIIGVGALVLMAVMLFGIQWVKFKLLPEVYDEKPNQS